VNRYNIWNIGLGAALLVAIAVPGVLHRAKAAPESRPGGDAPLAQTAGTKSFVPVCKGNQVADTRPDPAWVGASYAHDNCWAPRTPARLDGYTATREQIVAAMAAVKSYAASSDAYQKCISDFVRLRKAQAGKDKKLLDAALILIENHRITASQENKRKVAEQVEVAINAFNEYGSECPE
jgi:hypothetical protein